MYSLLITMILLLCILLALQLMQIFSEKIRYSRAIQNGGVIILPISENCNDVEYLIRNAVSQINSKHNTTARLFLLDIGASEDTLNICRIFCRKLHYIELCTPYELAEKLKSVKNSKERLV